MSTTATPIIESTTIPASTSRPTVPDPRRLRRGVMALALAAGVVASVTVGAVLDGDDTTGRARLSSAGDTNRDASRSSGATSVDAYTFDPSVLASSPAATVDAYTFDPSVLGTDIPSTGGAQPLSSSDRDRS